MSTEKYTWDGQDAKIVEKIHGKILDMLTAGESINYIAIQKKPAVTLLPDSITVSNKRIFLGEFTKLGLATNFEIFSWQDIKDISFKEEIFGSKVTVIPYRGENLTIDYIPKVQARKLYQLIKDALNNIQKEKSAPKGKVVTDNPPPADTLKQPTSTAPAQPDQKPGSFFSSLDESLQQAPRPVRPEEDDEVAKKLTRLKNLFDKQLISQAEYESKKTEILKDL